MTPQTPANERHSNTPEFPDIQELLSNSVMEDVQPLSDTPEDADTTEPDTVELVMMRVEPHDKPRRLLVLPSSGVLSVTMRGSLDLVKQGPLRRTALRTGGTSEECRQFVDDACLLRSSQDHLIAVGRVSDAQQLSIVRIRGENVRAWIRLCSITDRIHPLQVTDVGTFDRPIQPGKKGGISAVSTMAHPGAFVTGGYDHVVHWWSFSEEHGATPTPLAIRHTSTIQSLVNIHDTSDKLLSGSADCSVSVYDIASERVVNILKLSNSVYQVHAVPSPSCGLFEVRCTRVHRKCIAEVLLRLVTGSSSSKSEISVWCLRPQWFVSAIPTQKCMGDTLEVSSTTFLFMLVFIVSSRCCKRTHVRLRRKREGRLRTSLGSSQALGSLKNGKLYVVRMCFSP